MENKQMATIILENINQDLDYNVDVELRWKRFVCDEQKCVNCIVTMISIMPLSPVIEASYRGTGSM